MKKKDKSYGYKQYQDGGMPPEQIQVPGPVEAAPEDSQMMAQQFVEAYQQLPVEVQQMVMEILMQPQQ